MNDSILSAEAKQAIQKYMIRLVSLPGAIIALGAFAAGFFVNDVAKQSAYNDAYKEATTNIVALAQVASNAANDAKSAKERFDVNMSEVQTLQNSAKSIIAENKRLKEDLKSAQLLVESQNIIKQVSDKVLRDSDFSGNIMREVSGRITKLEHVLTLTQEGRNSCEWVNVGYNKSHYHDPDSWCSANSFIRQIDLDGCGSGSNCPIVGRVQCCTILAQAGN